MKNAMHRLTIAGLVLLLALTVSPNQCIQNDAVAQTTQVDEGIIEVDINPRGTYLHAVDWYPQFGPGPSDLTPTTVDLQAVGLNPGDQVMLSIAGRYSPWAGWGTPESDKWLEADEVNLLGVFSTTSTLEPLKDRHRVSGAIEYGEDYVTPVTWWEDLLEERNSSGYYDPPLKGGNEPTDIPEDFQVTPYSGMFIEIPRNARFLMFTFPARYYSAGEGDIRVTIEKDTDGDGLPDSWELNGLDVNKDGEVDLDLPMLQADWERKDIFVEADYMFGLAPRQDAIDDVIDAFASNGINLHVMIDEQVDFAAHLNGWGEYYGIKASHIGTAAERANPNTIEAKKKVFRYCLFVWQIWLDPPDYDCPGLAEGAPCDDFILAFGALEGGGSRKDQAAVFMHELGHALGLHHGGNTRVNYKPNYLSVMNYAFAYDDWVPGRPLDYSHGLCDDLDETNLDEGTGIGFSAVTVWRGPDGVMRRSEGGLAIDWDCDNVATAGAQVNVNDNPKEPSPADEVLRDYNDWANLVYRFRGTRLFAASAAPEDYHVELTAKEMKQMEEEGQTMVVMPAPEQAETGSGFPMAVIYALVGVGAVATATAAVLLYRRRLSQSVGE